jgi:signal transduction histidine kinase
LLVLKCVALALLYAVTARFGYGIDRVQTGFRAIYPQSGVALGGLLVFGLGAWPGIVAGSLYVSLSSKIIGFYPLGLGFAIGNTLGPLAAAWLLTRWAHLDRAFNRVRDIYVFLLFGVIVAPLVSGTIAVVAFSSWEAVDLDWPMIQLLWVRRCFGHAISNLVMAPLMLAWARKPRQKDWSTVRYAEGVLLLTALVAVCMVVFTRWPVFGLGNHPANYAPFPFVIWAALRFGQRGAATTTFLISVMVLVGASRGAGLFGNQVQSQTLVLLQIYLAVTALSAMFLAAAISEHEAAENRLLASREQLKALSAQLMAAREEERAHISREIHDELGQQLTGIIMGLRSLRKKLPADPPDFVDRTGELTGMVEESLSTIREIASDLRPGILDDLGIVECMQWQVRDFQSRTGIAAQFEPPEADIDPGPESSTALFRILQEALTNVARHAGATSVSVALRREADNAVLEVRDNGRGIRPDALLASGSLGVVGMKERAELLGGEVTVGNMGFAPGDGGAGQEVSSTDPGTLVRATIPITEPGTRRNRDR